MLNMTLHYLPCVEVGLLSADIRTLSGFPGANSGLAVAGDVGSANDFFASS